jgi:hypothetical protein
MMWLKHTGVPGTRYREKWGSYRYRYRYVDVVERGNKFVRQKTLRLMCRASKIDVTTTQTVSVVLVMVLPTEATQQITKKSHLLQYRYGIRFTQAHKQTHTKTRVRQAFPLGLFPSLPPPPLALHHFISACQTGPRHHTGIPDICLVLWKLVCLHATLQTLRKTRAVGIQHQWVVIAGKWSRVRLRMMALDTGACIKWRYQKGENKCCALLYATVISVPN